MTSIAITVVVTLLLVGGQAAQRQERDASTPPTGTIRGRVSAADTGKPLRRARVDIMSASESALRPVTASTNSSGEFEVRDLAPGFYLVRASRAGYLTTEFGQRRAREGGLPIEIRDGSAERVEIVLPRGAVLAGQILDELGHPYPGVRVDAMDMRYDLGRRQPFPASGATTDDLGQFRISGLSPGSYYVMATSNETWRNEKKESLGYASTYYPGVSADAAQVIVVEPGQQRSGLNMTLAVTRTVRVSGRVLRPSGEPLAGGSVSMMYSYPGSVVMTAGARSTKTGADGTFEFRDVSSAMYMLSSGGASVDVAVGTADVEGLVLAQKTGSTVTGSVITEEGTRPSISASGVRVFLVAPDDDVLPTVRLPAVEGDWSFKLQSLGGNFLFRLRGLPEDWTLAAVRLGEKDITDTPWNVPTGGQNIPGLTIVITQRISRVSGTVVDDSGRPTSSASLIVFPDDRDQWIAGARTIRAIRPDAGGRFTISGLPGGSYRAIAREFVEQGQWEDRTFLESIRDQAQTFLLTDGGTHSLTLTVVR